MTNTRVTISLPAHAAEKLARMGSAELTDMLAKAGITGEVKSITVLSDKQRTNRTNTALCNLGKIYHDEFPLLQINAALQLGGFTGLDEAAFAFITGQGHIHQQVGAKTWLTISWYTMPSGRLEIVAYVS